MVLPYFSLVLPLFHQSKTKDWQVSRSLCKQGLIFYVVNCFIKKALKNKFSGLVQKRCNSYVLAMELYLFSTNPLICTVRYFLTLRWRKVVGILHHRKQGHSYPMQSILGFGDFLTHAARLLAARILAYFCANILASASKGLMENTMFISKIN